MRLRTIATVVASILLLAACSGGAEEPPSVLETVPGDAPAQTTSTAVAAPSEANVIAFQGVPPPTLAIYTSEGGSGSTACREYRSDATPTDIVTDHTTDLEALGWTVSDLIRTGYRHSDRASFSATKDGRNLHARGEGDTATSAVYVLCVSTS